jgi:hypothetical protein
MKRPLLPALFVFLRLCGFTHARIGESIEQCDARYGQPTFTHQDRDLASRFYRFNNKRIRVTFVSGSSVLENIVDGPAVISGTVGVKQFTARSIQFFRGLLSSAYNFSDEQTSELGNLHQKTPLLVRSGNLKNGNIGALCSFDWDANQTSIVFTGMVADHSIMKGALADRVIDHEVKSITLESRSQERAKASGF